MFVLFLADEQQMLQSTVTGTYSTISHTSTDTAATSGRQLAMTAGCCAVCVTAPIMSVLCL